MNRALSTCSDRSQRGSRCASAKIGCTNTSRKSPLSGKDGPSHAADDRGDEHQDRYQVQYEEAPQTVRLYAFAAQDPEAREEELDRNGENEQPGKYDERPSRYIHPISLRKSYPQCVLPSDGLGP